MVTDDMPFFAASAAANGGSLFALSLIVCN